MGKLINKLKKRSRDAPQYVYVNKNDWWKYVLGNEYVPIYDCPEVQMCVNVIADLVSSMTLHLMENTELGDKRIKNGLSRKIDIDPNPYMNRKTFFYNIVKTMLTAGDGNCVVVPIYTADGYIDSLNPLPPSEVFFENAGNGYQIRRQEEIYTPDEVLHFSINNDVNAPWRGTGYTIPLKSAVECISQANNTKKSLQSSPAPSLIVQVDGLSEDYYGTDGRKKLLDKYAGGTGETWVIPAEMMSVKEVKPLTLTDLAIKEGLELDKRTIAGIYRVPSFMVGVGSYNEEEYNFFVTTVIMGIAQIIQQELTSKLLYSTEMYFKFNPRSLYNYRMTELISSGIQLVDRGIMRGNELRDWIGVEPDPDMEELYVLENYIPLKRLGDQKKLIGGENERENNS